MTATRIQVSLVLLMVGAMGGLVYTLMADTAADYRSVAILWAFWLIVVIAVLGSRIRLHYRQNHAKPSRNLKVPRTKMQTFLIPVDDPEASASEKVRSEKK